MSPTLLERYQGSLLGLACGDAVGTTVEFRPRDSFTPVTDMLGGGPFNLLPGQWTDDTSMALCLAESLLAKQGFDATDQMGRYVNWWQWGYLSATGTCFDIGMTVSDALARYQQTDEPFSGSTHPRTAGNGSLMRLAPVVLFYYPRRDALIEYSALSSRTTHGAPEALESCVLFALILAKALAGETKDAILSIDDYPFNEPKVADLARAAYLGKTREQIVGSGYCIASLEAALWCFAHSESFAEAVLLATNLGDDADTTAAITGQIAGAFYGVEGIPCAWRERLYMGKEIEEMAQNLLHT